MCRQTAAREVVCKVGDGVGGGSGVAEKKGRMEKKKRRASTYSHMHHHLAPKIFISTAICSFTALLLVPPVASLSSTARS